MQLYTIILEEQLNFKIEYDTQLNFNFKILEPDNVQLKIKLWKKNDKIKSTFVSSYLNNKLKLTYELKKDHIIIGFIPTKIGYHLIKTNNPENLCFKILVTDKSIFKISSNLLINLTCKDKLNNEILIEKLINKPDDEKDKCDNLDKISFKNTIDYSFKRQFNSHFNDQLNKQKEKSSFNLNKIDESNLIDYNNIVHELDDNFDLINHTKLTKSTINKQIDYLDDNIFNEFKQNKLSTKMQLNKLQSNKTELNKKSINLQDYELRTDLKGKFRKQKSANILTLAEKIDLNVIKQIKQFNDNKINGQSNHLISSSINSNYSGDLESNFNKFKKYFNHNESMINSSKDHPFNTAKNNSIYKSNSSINSIHYSTSSTESINSFNNYEFLNNNKILNSSKITNSLDDKQIYLYELDESNSGESIDDNKKIKQLTYEQLAEDVENEENNQFMFRKQNSSIKNSRSDLRTLKDQYPKSPTYLNTSLNRKLVKKNSSIHSNYLKNKFNLESLLDGLDHNRNSVQNLFNELYLNDDKLSDEKINDIINKKSTKETDLKKSNLNTSIYLNSLIGKTNLSKSEINLLNLNTSLNEIKLSRTHLNEQNWNKGENTKFKRITPLYGDLVDINQDQIGKDNQVDEIFLILKEEDKKEDSTIIEHQSNEFNKLNEPTDQQKSSFKEETIINDNFLPVQKLVKHWTNTNIDTNAEIKITVDANNLPIRTNSIRNRRAIFEQMSTDQNKENSIKLNDNLRITNVKQRKSFWESLCNNQC